MGGKKGEQEEKRKEYLWLTCKINEKELIKKSSPRTLHAQGIPKNIHTKLYSKAQPQKRQDIEKE